MIPPDEPSITPYAGGPVPQGHLVVRNQDGERHLLDLDAAKAARDKETPSELTPEQVRRVEVFMRVVSEHSTMTLEETLANVRRDRTPEREIRVWERIAHAYSDEVRARPQADAAERRLLFKSLFACSFTNDLDEVFGMVPDARSLPDLERAIRRYYFDAS